MEKPVRPAFSLTALLLAPWAAPLICCTLLTFSMGGKPSLAFFLITSGVGLVISYLGTAALAVALWFIAQVRPVTPLISALTGIALAAVGYIPFIFINWHSSGPDSGPPIDSFASYLLRSVSDPFTYIFLAAGLITALLYSFLAQRGIKSGKLKTD